MKRGGMIVAAAFLAGALLPGEAAAQALDFGTGGDDPIEIYADNGIEWQRDSSIFLAHGNARAVKGEVSVQGDILRAYYRENDKGGTDIWRLDAEGKVKIISSGETATCKTAVYDVDNAVLVLSGRPVRLVSGQDTITAYKQIEYWEKKLLAVARGNAEAVRGDKRLRADVLAAYSRRNKAGKTRVYRVEAFYNVRIDAASDVVRADRAVYNVDSGIATLAGSVKIDRGGNRLRGCSAKVDLNTGVSRLFACQGPGDGRVQGVLQPDSTRPTKKGGAP